MSFSISQAKTLSDTLEGAWVTALGADPDLKVGGTLGIKAIMESTQPLSDQIISEVIIPLLIVKVDSFSIPKEMGTFGTYEAVISFSITYIAQYGSLASGIDNLQNVLDTISTFVLLEVATSGRRLSESLDTGNAWINGDIQASEISQQEGESELIPFIRGGVVEFSLAVSILSA